MFKSAGTTVVKTNKIPEFYISDIANEKITYIIKKMGGKEVAWLGIVQETEPNSYLLEDILIPRQESTATTVEIREEFLAEFMMNILSEEGGENKYNKIRLWGHSHHSMGVSPSAQDDTQFDTFIQQFGAEEINPFFFRMICNNKDDIRLDMYDNRTELVFHHLPVTQTRIFVDAFYENLDETLSTNVTEKAYKIPSASTTRNWDRPVGHSHFDSNMLDEQYNMLQTMGVGKQKSFHPMDEFANCDAFTIGVGLLSANGISDSEKSDVVGEFDGLCLQYRDVHIESIFKEGNKYTDVTRVSGMVLTKKGVQQYTEFLYSVYEFTMEGWGEDFRDVVYSYLDDVKGKKSKRSPKTVVSDILLRFGRVVAEYMKDMEITYSTKDLLPLETIRALSNTTGGLFILEFFPELSKVFTLMKPEDMVPLIETHMENMGIVISHELYSPILLDFASAQLEV